MIRWAKPTDAVVAVTYRCNARCAMCGIWNSPPREELPPSAYLRLPETLRDINLTGGEPFLRDDLPEIHAAVRRACPRAQTIVSTNGILTDKIVLQVREMARRERNIGIAISLDGPAEVHDKMRGVPGTYDRAMATLKALQTEGFCNLRLAFTITQMSIQHVRTVHDLSHQLGVEFTCAVQHASEHYFQSSVNRKDFATPALREQLESVIRSELSGLSPKRWARAWFTRGLWEFVSRRARPLACRAGADFFFLDPSGAIFTCNAMPFKMGELNEGSPAGGGAEGLPAGRVEGDQGFWGTWESNEAEHARAKADGCEAGCWMVCTVRTVMRRNWPKVLAWALRRKFLQGEILRP